MTPSVSSSGASISGSAGGQKGSVGINTNGTVNVGIDVAGIKLGVTNDYGGAARIGFGGQSVTWGATGGKSNFGIGGFEVIVEARDCVVVETKKIAGMIVLQRSYPDPGCKELPQKSRPLTSNENQRLGYSPKNMPNLDPKCIYYFGILIIANKKETWGFLPSFGYLVPDRWEETLYTYADYSVHIKGINPYNPQTGSYSLDIGGDGVMTSGNNGTRCIYSDFPPGDFKKYYQRTESFAIHGGIFSPTEFNYRINNYYLNPKSLYFLGPGTMIIVDVPISCNGIPSPRYSPPSLILFVSNPNPSAGNRPPMPESCCESLKADIEDIKQVLATKEMLGRKMQIPGELLEIQTDGMPTPKPEFLLNYAQVANATLLAINRYGIDAPIQVQIKDTDTTKKGDQSDEFTYNSPSVAMQAILELLWEIKGDNASRLKIQVRIAYAVTRALKIVAGVSESIRTLIKMLGLPFHYGSKKLLLEFDLSAAKKGSGFGKSQNARKGTSSTEAELEALLPGLLTEVEYELPVPVLNAEDDDIRELLVKILIAIQTQPGK